MKRIILLTVITCCSLLAACNDTSVGVIGGADGPTKIFVESNNETEKEPVKMVNVDGELYFELDEESEIEARCGVLDGNFSKSVGTFEIPKSDGETNFLGAEGYQIGANENTIEIPIGDDWEIFKKLDTNRDVLKYKYCYTVEGTLPNAQSDSKFLVLADVFITFQEASYQLLGSDTGKMKDIYVLPIAD